MASHHVNLHAGLGKRAQHARLIHARRARAAQQHGRAKARRVGRVGHAQLSSSWIVTSLTISKLRWPAGVETSTSSPASLPTKARPTGEATEIMPLSGLESSGITSS